MHDKITLAPNYLFSIRKPLINILLIFIFSFTGNYATVALIYFPLNKRRLREQ